VAQSVVRGIGGQNREPERVHVVSKHHASVVIGFDEKDGLRSWHGDLPFWNGGEATVQFAAGPVSYLTMALKGRAVKRNAESITSEHATAQKCSGAICTDILHFPARVLVMQAARPATGERR
jgi:hypothetical protein